MKKRKNMPRDKKPLSLKEMQHAEYEMLYAFDKFCERHDLNYYLVGGTLLGAIRHRGFIPWDDDIDVGMPRDDFERMLDIAEKEAPAEHIKVLSYRSDKISQPYAQMIRSDIRLVKSADSYSDKYRLPYLWVDIFPVDGFPKGRLSKTLHLKKMAAARFLSVRARARLGRGTSLVHTVGKIPFILLGRLIGVKRLRSYITRTALKYPFDKCDEVGIAVNGFYGVGEAYKKSDAFPLVKVGFEGSEFYAPACYDSYLHGIYGDYMKLPPQEKRRVHMMKAYRTDS